MRFTDDECRLAFYLSKHDESANWEDAVGPHTGLTHASFEPAYRAMRRKKLAFRIRGRNGCGPLLAFSDWDDRDRTINFKWAAAEGAKL